MTDTPNEDATQGKRSRAKLGRRSLLMGSAAAGVPVAEEPVVPQHAKAIPHQ